MKLSQREADIIACCDMDTDAPIKQLKKLVGLREHSIRYALRRLIAREIIKPVPLINLHSLGGSLFNLFFSTGALKAKAREALLRDLAGSSNVIWVGEFGGEFQYGVDIAVSHVSELVQLIEKLANKHGDAFFDKTISSQHAVTVFPRKYLSSKKGKIKSLTAKFSGKATSMDELDAKILSTKASFGALSHRQLALKVGIPLSTFELRIAKMKERGLLVGSIYAVNATLFGYQRFKLLVYAKGIHAALRDSLFKFCEEHRNVVYFVECVGAWDYEINIEVLEAQNVTRIIQELYEEFGASISTIRSLSRFSDLKARWFPDLS